MRIFNSLSRSVEEFVSLRKGKVGMYTCGITVYDYAQIGNARKYVYDDILRRVLLFNGYEVNHVQNVTDVGHLVSDEDAGEDKLEKGAARVGKSVWEVAKYYESYFYEAMDKLNNMRPSVIARATDHIEDMVNLVKKLVEKGFAYDTPEAVYFDVCKFPRYEGLFGRQAIVDKQIASRIEVQTGDHKRNPIDFALWFKRVGRFATHTMHWDSPWGDGFPGWHIECSAMSMKYLGDTFDIHTGGIDHIQVHHPNEIAQSEAATGKQFVNFWLHYAFLTVDGTKMSKSLNNFYKLEDIVEKGFSPMALRYLYLTAHYRSQLNFTWSSITAAQTAFDKLREFVGKTRNSKSETRNNLSQEKQKKLQKYQERFAAAINDDLGLPAAIGVMWEMMKSNIPDMDKREQILEWDQVLGLRLSESSVEESVPNNVVVLGNIRQQLRNEGKYVEADNARMEIEKLGWTVLDTKTGPVLKKLALTYH